MNQLNVVLLAKSAKVIRNGVCGDDVNRLKSADTSKVRSPHRRMIQRHNHLGRRPITAAFNWASARSTTQIPDSLRARTPMRASLSEKRTLGLCLIRVTAVSRIRGTQGLQEDTKKIQFKYSRNHADTTGHERTRHYRSSGP